MKLFYPLLLALSFSCSATLPASPQAWKNITAGENTTLSFDGSLRERYEWTDHRDLGLNGKGREDILMQRLLLGARLNTSNYFCAYLQLGSSLSTHRSQGRKPTDEDHAYIGQGYMDLQLPTDYGKSLLRVGRQEIPLGSLHLLGTRDGANVRRSFDAIHSAWLWNQSRVDAFIAHPVEIRTGKFNDKTDNTQKIWGLYSTLSSQMVSSSLDFYYLGFESNESHYTQDTGEERRYTLGARQFGSNNNFDWDNELTWQFGHFQQYDIRAWAASMHSGYTVDTWSMKPRFGIKLGTASGDRNSHDRQLNTFNAMYPKLPYLTENGAVAPANLIDVHPSITLLPWQTISVELSWDAMWRQHSADGFYLGPMRPVPGSENGNRFLGNQYQIETIWTPETWLQLKAAYVYFDVSNSLEKHADLQNMNFLLTQVTFNF